MPRLRAADPKSSITPPLHCPLPHRHSDYLSFASRASRPCALPAPGRWSLAWPRRVSRSVNNWLVQVLVPGLGGSPRDPPLSLCQESLREPREGPEKVRKIGKNRKKSESCRFYLRNNNTNCSSPLASDSQSVVGEVLASVNVPESTFVPVPCKDGNTFVRNLSQRGSQ